MRVRIAVVAAALAACGGDGGGIPDGATCGLVITTSGGLRADVGGGNPACLTQFTTDVGTDGEMLLLDDPSGLESVGVSVGDITRSATGAFPAIVTLRTEAFTWSADGCTAQVDQNRDDGAVEFGHSYVIGGTLLCPEPAVTADDSAAPVRIDTAAWVYSVTFVD